MITNNVYFIINFIYADKIEYLNNILLLFIVMI